MQIHQSTDTQPEWVGEKAWPPLSMQGKVRPEN